tara:strand:+ start:3988 stop:6657 length:2670 start_codon:yes stop_codon:yes gene_type:complete
LAEIKIGEALRLGIEAHSLGKVQEADSYYTAILKAHPKHSDANHNMGVLAVSTGKVREAIPFFLRALETDRKIVQFWLSYIDALIKLGKFDDARAAVRDAKTVGVDEGNFENVEKRLTKCYEEPILPNNDAGPSKSQLQALVNSYTQGQLQIVVKGALKLLTQFPNSIILYNLLGVANRGLGKLPEAIDAYGQAIAINPNYVEAHNNMGNALMDMGKLEESIEAYQTAISINPDYIEAHNNLGNVLGEYGRLDDAVEAYNAAISLKLDHAEALNNVGNIFQKQKKLDEAIDSYQRAISINPNYAEAFNNMGNALKEQNKLDEAAACYDKAIVLNPNFAEAHNNKGVVLKKNGKLAESIGAYNAALTINSDYAKAYYNMGDALNGLIFNQPNPDLIETIKNLLEKKSYVRPKDIARAALSLLSFEPILQLQLQSIDGNRIKKNDFNAITELSKLPLLMTLMSVCPLPDTQFEKLLKAKREYLLLNISSVRSVPGSLKFLSAIALQCFINGYIYSQNEREEKALSIIEQSVRSALDKGNQPSSEQILILASYKSLDTYVWSTSIDKTNEIHDVHIQQIEEPRHERKLKSMLPKLHEITDETSSNVRDQYEDKPYPRWINLRVHLKPSSIESFSDEIGLKLFDNNIKEIIKPRVLIAGCGTGQHSIGTATRFEGSEILAVDLSSSSLAYAKRKSDELAIKNVDYMQADILHLRKLERQFDIIESVGVLHHMYDPLVGWSELVDCLKQGGLMKIGLYSELAREHIAKIRDEINNAEIGATEIEMKSFRSMLIESSMDHHKRILNSDDFYNLNTVRDLLFHVQEHRFNLSQINGYLDQLGLKFCGFEIGKVISHFKLNNTHSDDIYDLGKWEKYEEAYPMTFSGMYQFWCQKAS